MEKNLPASLSCALVLLLLIGCPSPSAPAPAPAPSAATGAVTGRAILVGNSDHLGLTITADSGQTISKTQTDSAGAYRLDGLAAGTYTLYASTQDSLEKAVAIGVSVEAGRTVTAPDLKLTPTGTLTGVVTLGSKSTGNLGILVYLAGTSYSAHTDDSGAWTMEGVAAGTSYTLIASLAGTIPSTPIAVTVSSGTTTPVTAIALATATALTFTVTYSGNGSTSGTAPSDANAYLSGATATVLGNSGSLVKTGSTFAGWNTKSDGTGIAYTPKSPLVVGTSGVTLYAVWTTAPTYTLTYNGNSPTSGTAPSDANAYLSGATATVLGNSGSLVKTGSTFAGWNTKSDGTGIAYTTQSPLVVGTSGVTLYAVWTTAPTYTLTYNGNSPTSGTAPSDANAYLSAATATVLGNTGNLARTYYTFNGWNTRADGTGTAFTVGSSLVVGTSNLTLYAQWTKQIGSTATVTTPPVYVVTISGPSTVSYGQTANFTSTYTGTAQAYLWFVDGTAAASPWGTAASYAYSPTVSTATFGAHLITLLVTDVNGITYSTSQTVSVGN